MRLFLLSIICAGAQICLLQSSCQSCTSSFGCVWSGSTCATNCLTMGCVTRASQCPVPRVPLYSFLPSSVPLPVLNRPLFSSISYADPPQPYAISTPQPYAMSTYQLPQQFMGAREQAVLNVVKGVNYALALEHLESAYYRATNSILSSDSDYARLSSINGERFNIAVLHARFLEIGAHEDTHVVTLTKLVSTLCALIPTVPNCAPVSACTYTFDLGNTAAFDKSINTIVATAELLENTGVKAYDGAISSLIQTTPLSLDGSLDSASIVEAAATIATVEARHAAFLSTIRGMNPFPQAQDTPVKPNAILCTARQFVVNPSTCPVFNTATC